MRKSHQDIDTYEIDQKYILHIVAGGLPEINNLAVCIGKGQDDKKSL